MPFSEKQKRQHIIEVQRYLHAIALMNEKIPVIIPDGVYGSETRTAVTAFQREYSLRETGTVDSVTWNKIVAVYKGLFHSLPEPYPAFPSEKFVCGHGACGQLVYIIQAMLYGFGQSYDNFPEINVCGNFNDETADIVKKFQNICGLPPSGKVDCATWNMLVHLSAHHK